MPDLKNKSTKRQVQIIYSLGPGSTINLQQFYQNVFLYVFPVLLYLHE
jgi:hypothetical protein